MVLTNEQLRGTLTGAVEITEKNGVLVPLRFGRHIRESVYPAGNRFNVKMTQSAGVVCRFTTNSRSLAFSYTVNEVSNEQNFDVWVNGVFLSHTVCDALAGRVEMELPYERSKVEIYFPSHREGRITDVTLDDGAEFELPAAPKHRILFKGDSITNGSSAHFTSMGYPHQVARALDAYIVNQGIGGEMFNPAAVDTALEEDFDLIVVAFGTNDWSHAPSRTHFVGAVNGFMAALRDKYPTQKIAMILPLWRADHILMNKPTGTFMEARDIIYTAAARFDAEVIDGLQLVPHIIDVFADKRLHPDEFGFQFYADNLVPQLKALLEK